MLDDRTRNLGFLLTLSPLLVACPAADDDTGAGTGTSTGGAGTTGQPTPTPTTLTAGSDAADGSTTGTVDPTTGSADSGGSESATGGSATSSTSDGPGTSSGGDGSGTTEGSTGDGASSDGASTGGGQEPCEAYGELVAGCYGGDANQYAGYCQESYDYYTMLGAACGTAFDELVACFNLLSCREIAAGAFCEVEFAAFENACPV